MPASLSHVIKELQSQIHSSENLIIKVESLAMPRIQVEIIVELAFLRIFMSWEEFLEESFIRYLVGAKSHSGYSPRRFVDPPNMKIAAKLITGVGREYVTWNSVSDVIERSEIYFKEGEPYRTALQAATTEINEMNTIRNRIAHKSTNAKSKFRNLVRRKLGHGIRGMTAGRFLLTATIPPLNGRYLDHYVAIIKTASLIIVR